MLLSSKSVATTIVIHALWRAALLHGRKKGPFLPKLYKLALRHLALKGFSVAAERVFSTEETVISDRKSCLDPAMVNIILFLNKILVVS